MSTFVAVLKWVVGIGLLMLVILGGAGVFLYPQIKEMVAQTGGDRGTPVTLHEVQPDRLVRTVSAPGQVLPKMDVNISARVSARIVELPVEPGEKVEQGQVLCRLEDREYVAALDSARARLRAEQAQLEGARATFVNAVAEWERTKSLHESKDVSKADLDAAEANKDRAEASLRAAEQNIEVA
ncbi:MAG: biotin/lipoyl-binding protein, partial [Planctomycetota bacterium]|nr:biotin/lipoyl-binding protein [Planctomycetota bacterium]